MNRLCLATLLLVAHCHDTTGGALISLPFQIGGVQRDAAQTFTFTTTSGWTVTLTRALAVVGPFYFNIQPPDPDFFRSGVVIVQATEQVVVDALDPTLHDVAGGVDGETGHAVAVEIDFFTTTYQFNQLITLPAPLLGADPDGAKQSGTAYLEGQASKGQMTIAFAGRIVIDENAITASIPIEAASCVQGAFCDLQFTAAAKTLSLRIDPSYWFDAQPDFCDLVPGSSGGTCQPVDGQIYGWTSNKDSASYGFTSAFNAALLSGLKSSNSAYSFALED